MTRVHFTLNNEEVQSIKILMKYDNYIHLLGKPDNTN